MKKFHETEFEIETKDKFAKSEETAFVTPIFFGFRMIGRADFTYYENFKKFAPKQIEEIQSQITTCECFPLWNFCSTTKIIILMLTTANDSLILVYYVLVTFSNLENWKNSP